MRKLTRDDLQIEDTADEESSEVFYDETEDIDEDDFYSNVYDHDPEIEEVEKTTNVPDANK